MGLGLAGLELVSSRGWWGGLTALISLVPMAVALAFNGSLAAGLTGAVALAAVGLARGGAAAVGGPAMRVVCLKYVLPGIALGLSLARRLPVAVTTLLTAAASLVGVIVLLWVVAPAGVGPLAYLERQIAAHAADLEQWPARLG